MIHCIQFHVPAPMFISIIENILFFHFVSFLYMLQLNLNICIPLIVLDAGYSKLQVTL